ncbi:MAG: dienelactone hydrolase family protein [Sphingomonadales bacterium]
MDGFLAVPEAGSGPGIVMLQEIFGVNEAMRATARLLAEEGYVVLVPDLFWRLERGVELGYDDAEMAKAFSLYQRFQPDAAVGDIGAALAALKALPECTGGAALMGFCLGGTLAVLASAVLDADAAVAFYPVALQDVPDAAVKVRCPTQIHLGGADPLCPPEAAAALAGRFARDPNMRVHVYPGADHAFFNPARPQYDRIASDLALTRALELLRPRIGPVYDLLALWERHTYHEFASKDADETIETMVERPYVNHVPSMTGGTGRHELRHFYRHYFVHAHPDDYGMVLVSRTVGVNRIVDEMVVSFTHDRMIDYMLPGIPATGRKIMIAATAVVSFRGPRIRHEHLYYDQASLLAQVGRIEPEALPVAGVEQAKKVLDPFGWPSNTLMTTWAPPAREEA